MCGIVGAVADRSVPAILLEGLQRLEYRGYDSAGIAVIVDGTREFDVRRRVGNVVCCDVLHKPPGRRRTGSLPLRAKPTP